MTVPMIPKAPVVPMVVVAVPVAAFPTVVEGEITFVPVTLVPVAAPMVTNPVGGGEPVAIFPASGPVALVVDFSIAASLPRLVFAVGKFAVTEIPIAGKISPRNVATRTGTSCVADA